MVKQARGSDLAAAPTVHLQGESGGGGVLAGPGSNSVDVASSVESTRGQRETERDRERERERETERERQREREGSS